MNILRSIELVLLRYREYRKAWAELGTYSESELNGELGLRRSDIPAAAAATAAERVAAFVQANPRCRDAGQAPDPVGIGPFRA